MPKLEEYVILTLAFSHSKAAYSKLSNLYAPLALVVMVRIVLPLPSCSATVTPAMPVLSGISIVPLISPYGVRQPSAVA